MSSFSTESYIQACRVEAHSHETLAWQIWSSRSLLLVADEMSTDRRAKTGMEFTIRMRSRQLCHRSFYAGLHLLPSVASRGCKAALPKPFCVAGAYHPAVSYAFMRRLCFHLHAKAARPCRRVTAKLKAAACHFDPRILFALYLSMPILACPLKSRLSGTCFAYRI